MGFPQRADVHINGAFSGEEAEDGDEADAAAVTARREAQAGGCQLLGVGNGSFVRSSTSQLYDTCIQFVAAIDPYRQKEDMKDTMLFEKEA